MKLDSVFVSTGAFPSRDVGDILQLAREWGVSRVELSSDVCYRADNLEIVRRKGEDFRFLVHNYFPAPEQPFVLNLASSDAESLERSRMHCLQALQLSAELEAPFFAAHAGFAIQPRPDQLGRPLQGEATPRGRSYRIFLDSVGELVEAGKRLGVDFLIENNVLSPGNLIDGGNPFLLLVEADEIQQFARDIGDDFGLLLDVAHLKVSATTLEFDPVTAMQALSGLTRAYHLSDNDGFEDQNRAFDETAWFLPYLKPDCLASIEVYKTDNNTIGQCFRALQTSSAHD